MPKVVQEPSTTTGLRDRKVPTGSEKVKSTYDSAVSFGGALLRVALIFGLLCALLNSLRGQPLNFSFEWFLNVLETAPVLDFKKMSSLLDFTITADWGILNGLRNFINGFSNVYQVIVFISTGTVNAITFVLHFLKNIFFF